MTKTAANSANGDTSAAIVLLGYDENGKPRAAQFTTSNAGLVAKAAQAMRPQGLKAVEPRTRQLRKLIKKLPVGASIPTATASCLTSGVTSTSSSRRPWHRSWTCRRCEDETPSVATGLPRTWDEIGPGHLVIAQETS